MTKISDVLMKEWEICEQAIARFDSLHFQVRGWAVSAFGILIGVAITANEGTLPILACAVTLAFWLVEANFKSYQLEFIDRTAVIQRALRRAQHTEGSIAIPHPLIANQFELRKRNRCRDISQFFKALFQFNVWLPYVLLIFVGLGFSYYLRGRTEKPVIVQLAEQPRVVVDLKTGDGLVTVPQKR